MATIQSTITTNTTADVNQSDRWAYLWLAVGALLLRYTAGNQMIPLAAWLAPVFYIRFMRSQKPFRGYILVAIVSGVMLAFALSGVAPGVIYAPAVIGAALIGNLPLVADRLLVRRLPGLSATLVFPLAVTTIEFANAATNPVGSFGLQAYSQYGNLALMQLASVTGLWGITFLLNWFATTVNWAWERSFAWPEIGRGAAIYGGVLALVLGYGHVRLLSAPLQADTVRVAAFTAGDIREMEQRLQNEVESISDRETLRQILSERYEPYFAGTLRESQAGAEIVVWPEGAAGVLEEDEAALVARGQEVAQQEGIYLVMPMFVIYQDEQRPMKNVLLIIDPQGDVVLEHIKYGGNMFEGSVPGDGVLRTTESPYGTLSGVICWDADFPATVRQAGMNGTDMLFVPSADWREIDPLHAQMAVFRAIENGVSLVRQADNGLSIITDPYGRVLAQMDHFTAGERVMVGQVPVAGVPTLYARIGDLFAWLSVMGLGVMVVWGVMRGRADASGQPD